MDVSIIIVNYNTKALLKQCLESVFEKTQGIEFEVIVVDNASRDGSPQMLKEEFPQVRLIESAENVGFGRGNNEGVKIARGNYLFLLNPDTVLLNNAVKILANYLDAHPEAGCCGGNLFDGEDNPTLSFGRLFPPLSYFDGFVKNCISKMLHSPNTRFNHTGNPLEVAYLTGADIMISNSLFQKLNGFDSDFFMYCEEVELQYRVKKAGYRRVSVPEARITHLEGKSLSINQVKVKYWYESRRNYLRKTQNRCVAAVTSLVFFAAIVTRLAYFALIKNRDKYEYWLTAYNAFFAPPPCHKSMG